MATKKTKKSSKPQPANNNRKTGAKRLPVRRRRPLDSAAMAYARLLSDPCGAPVVHPIYPGGDAGYVFRAESFLTFGTAVGINSGILHWAPGYVNSSATHLIRAEGTSSTANIAMTATGSESPGTSFLQNNAKGARCVAACLKVTFPGAESARAGRIHYGLTSAGLLDSGQNTNADAVAQTLQHFTRTPADTVELYWRPGIGDTEITDPSETGSALLRDRKTALTVAFAGLPAAVGLTFHFTAIYEWTPTAGLGIGHNAMGKAVSDNTLDDVVDYLQSAGFNFVKHAGSAAGTFLASRLVQGISNTFGVMPARSYTRRLNF